MSARNTGRYGALSLKKGKYTNKERLRAALTLHADGKKFEGVAVTIRQPKKGVSYRGGEVKNFSKKPLNIGFTFDDVKEYGPTVGLGLAGRKVLEVIELTEEILLVTFEGTSGNYHAVVFQPSWEYMRRPTRKPGEIAVAFSDKAPKAGEEYECTVVETINTGETATILSRFEVVGVTYHGENLALCDTEYNMEGITVRGTVLVTFPAK